MALACNIGVLVLRSTLRPIPCGLAVSGGAGSCDMLHASGYVFVYGCVLGRLEIDKKVAAQAGANKSVPDTIFKSWLSHIGAPVEVV